MLLLIGTSVGLLAGLVTGFSGASGVMVVIPLVTLLLGIPIHQAIGTSLLADVLISTPVAWSYWRYGDVRLRRVLYLLMGALVGAQFGAHEAATVPSTFLAFALSVFLLGMGVVMYRRGLPKVRFASALNSEMRVPSFLSHPLGLLGIGVLLGLLTGLFGAGGGLLAFLVLYFVLCLPLREAVGTSAAFMLFAALSGVLGYVGEGSIRARLGILIGAGGIIGGTLASYIAHHVPDYILARVIGGLFLILGVGMLLLRVCA